VRGLRSAILVACTVLPATRALALWDDKVTPFVEEKVTRDSNVFRLSPSLDPRTFAPDIFKDSTSLGDTYRVTSVGLNVDLPVSRQRFQLGYARNYSRYDHFTELDLDGYDGRALWLWQLGNDANGQLSYTENLSLASFANIAGVKPDPLKVRQAQLNGAYLVTPRWRLQLGATGFQQRNGETTLRVNDIDIVGGDASLAYATPANTFVGVGVRAEDGRFPNRPFVPASSDPNVVPSVFDNAYRQYGVDLVADWTVTGLSRLNARVGRISRRNEHLSERDFYGTAVRVQYDWKPTGRLSLNASVVQDISPYDDIKASYVFVKGVSFRPTFALTGKIDVSGIFEYSIRDYLGDPNLAPADTQGTLPTRTDHVRSATLALSYRPIRVITLQASAQRETRSSTIPFGDYEVNVYSLSARLAF